MEAGSVSCSEPTEEGLEVLTLENGEILISPESEDDSLELVVKKIPTRLHSVMELELRRVLSVPGYEESSAESSRSEQRRRCCNWVLCGIPRKTCFRNRRGWRFPQPGATHQSLIVYALILSALIYGFLYVFRHSGASFDPADYKLGDLMLVFSRAAGKVIQLFWVLGLVIVVRGFNNSVNEFSFEHKQWLAWRALHKTLMAMSMVAAVIHIVFHMVRIYHFEHPGPSPLPRGYDLYQTGVGLLLFALICAIAAFHPFRASANERVARCGARWFRAVHWQLYWVVAAVYAIHCYSMLPLLLWIIWTTDYYLNQVPVKKLFCITFSPDEANPKRRLTCIVCRVGVFSPQGTGVYYQLALGSGFHRMWASYSAIPVGSRALAFMIAPSTWTERLDKLLRDVNYEYGVQNVKRKDMEFLRSIVSLAEYLDKPDTVVWDLERRGSHIGVGGVHEVPFQLFGPYHSNSSDVNAHSRCLVISSGIGSSVRDAIIAYQLQKNPAWRRLVCLHMAGRTPEPDATITSLEHLEHILGEKSPPIGMMVESIDIRCSTNIEFWNRVLLAAIPTDTTASHTHRSENDALQLLDDARYVVIVCGRKAAEVVQAAIAYHGPRRLSEEQVQYIDIEEFK